MTKSFKKARGPFFMMPGELISGGYKLHGVRIETKMSEYLGLDGLAVYQLIGNKQTGKKEHDERLTCIAADGAHLMSRPTFAKGLFRCWAYRLIAVSEWGGGEKRKYPIYRLINKWRTLIRMPDRLEQIHKLVAEHEKARRLRSNPSSKKYQHLKNIKSKIREIIV